MHHYHPRRRGWEPSWEPPLDDEAWENRQTASLGGIAISLLLIVIGLFLVHELRAKAQLEDCLLSGRTNCAVIAAPHS